MLRKKDLVDKIAESTELTKKDVEKVINALTASIIEGVKDEKKVQLNGFGTFEPRERAARVGHSPRTKEEIQIPATRTVGFKVSSTFKDALK